MTLADRTNWVNQVCDPGAINLYAANSIVIDECEFTKLSGQGIVLYEGCSNNTIKNSLIHNTADSAIQIGMEGQREASILDPPAEAQLLNNTVTNCKIENIGQDYLGACAIYLGHPRGTLISHNEISHVPYSGIAFSAGGKANEVTYSSDNEISYNYIHNYDEKLYDGAGIYTSFISANSKVYNNYINNNNSNMIEKIPAIEADGTKIVGGIYSDQGSSGWEHYNNVVDLPECGNHMTPLILWSPPQNNVSIHDNYVSSNNPGFVPGVDPSNEWYNNTYCPDADWPSAALDIINKAGPKLLFEDFDDGSLAEWTVYANQLATAAVVDIPSISDKSVEFNDMHPSESVWMKQIFDPQNGVLTAEFKFMQPETNDMYGMDLYGGTIAAVRILTKDNYITYRNAQDAHVNILAYTINTWYTVKIVANITTDTYDVYVDGVLRAAEVNFRKTEMNLLSTRQRHPGTGIITCGTIIFFRSIRRRHRVLQSCRMKPETASTLLKPGWFTWLIAIPESTGL